MRRGSARRCTTRRPTSSSPAPKPSTSRGSSPRARGLRRGRTCPARVARAVAGGESALHFLPRMNVLYFDPKFATPRASPDARLLVRAPPRGAGRPRHGRRARPPLHGAGPRRAAAGPARRPRDRRRHRRDLDRDPVRAAASKWKRILSYGGYTLAATLAAARAAKPDVVYASSTPLTVGLNGLAAPRPADPFVFEIQDVWPDGAGRARVPHEPGRDRRGQWLERTLYRAGRAGGRLQRERARLLVGKGVPAERSSSSRTSPRPSSSGRPSRTPAYFRGARARRALRRPLHGRDGEGERRRPARGGCTRPPGARRRADRIVALGNGSSGERSTRDAAGLPNLHVPPPVAREELARIVRAAGATITLYAPTRSSRPNSPNKFFDSLAAGKPLIVNTDGWLRRVAEENQAGRYVPAADGAALADALVRLAENPELAEELGRNGAPSPSGDSTATSWRAPARDARGRRLGALARRGVSRPAVILGLQPAGLALTRSLGRRGVPVAGVALEHADFGLRSRYLAERHRVLDPEPMSACSRSSAARPRTAPSSSSRRDAHVDLVLRNWDELRELAAIPLPDDPAPTAALRDKDGLAEVAEREPASPPPPRRRCLGGGAPRPRPPEAVPPEAARQRALRRRLQPQGRRR